MKFVTVRDFRNNSAQVWRQLKEVEEMVITSNGKPVALLTPLTDETLEPTLRIIRKAKALAAISTLQLQSAIRNNDSMPLRDINEEISHVRKARQT